MISIRTVAAGSLAAILGLGPVFSVAAPQGQPGMMHMIGGHGMMRAVQNSI